jgi:hypothetical protein
VAAREAAVAAEAARAGNQAQLEAQKGRGGGGTMGEGLVRAMAGIPAPFFEADYDLARCAEVQESLAAREADPSGAGQAVSINLLLQVTHASTSAAAAARLPCIVDPSRAMKFFGRVRRLSCLIVDLYRRLMDRFMSR